ncbi:ABC transporter ATP-binding protein [Marinimicrococcus flavescens]|uniref:ABC transporter ATP-binding protein n=1 Tax=Marinimicrococcus flavescens TaxID=3031815 RepID=A0AAP3UZ60_9PROT|nr:ABC transporter ATP-binding protein [Marinimicrococcus flavescens]
MLLQVDQLNAHYGKSHILHGVSFAIEEPVIASLLGRNGSGRSTTLKAMMGLVPPTSGSVRLGGAELAGRRPYAVARAGLGFVPEERNVFANLTVEENLVMGLQPARAGQTAWTIADMYTYFPRLEERRTTKAGNLSGGEKQMLTICRSLLGNPRVLLIDEPTEGLAPKIVHRVMEVVLDIQQRGVAVLLVEQKLTIALKVAHQILVMGHGHIAFSGSPEEFRERPEIRRQWLEVS